MSFAQPSASSWLFIAIKHRVASADQPSCSQRSRIRLRNASASSVGGVSFAGKRSSIVWTMLSEARAHCVGPFGATGAGASA